MAATRLIVMHANKGKSIAQCLKDRTDYAMNGEKTEQGAYVSSYGCNAEIADKEFADSKREYLQSLFQFSLSSCLALLTVPFWLTESHPCRQPTSLS